MSLAAVAALFLLPFAWFLHVPPLVAFYNDWLAAVLLLLACFACWGALRRELPVAPMLPAVVPLCLPLAVVILLQWGLGYLTHSSSAVFPLVVFALATAAVILGRVLAGQVGPERLLGWISIAAIIGGLFNIALQFMQLCAANGIHFRYVNFQSGNQYFGALAQVNNLATYLSWALAGTLYLYAVRRIRAASLFLLVLVLFAGMSLTLSRTGVLQVAGIALLGFWMLGRLPADERPAHWKWVLVLPLVFVVVNLGLPLLLDAVGFSSDGNSSLRRAAIQGLDGQRRLLYSQGLQLFLDHPWLGIGPGQLVFHQFGLLDHADKTLYALSTHNIVLDVFVLTGIAGALPFFVLLGLWLVRVLRQPMSLPRIAALLMLTTLGIHAMLELPHWYAFFLLPAGVLIGMLDGGVLRLPGSRWWRLFPLVFVVYGLIVAASLLHQFRELETLYRRYYVQDPTAAVANDGRVEKIHAFAQQTWFTGVTEFLLGTNLALNDIALEEKLAILERTVRYQPEPHAIYRYALLLALAGRQEEGIVLLARTRKMFPEAHDTIAAEFIRLGQEQPELFGRRATALKPQLENAAADKSSAKKDETAQAARR